MWLGTGSGDASQPPHRRARNHDSLPLRSYIDRVANTDDILKLRILTETKGFGLERALVRGCVRLWDPMLQANRPYIDGSKAWPIRWAIEFLKKQGDVS